MSFLGATGSGGVSGRLIPAAPTGVSLARKVVNNGSTPVYTVSFTAPTAVPKTTITGYVASFYYVVGSTEYLRGSCAITSGGDTTGSFLVTGDHYARVTASTTSGSSPASSNSATVTALTRPADMGTVTLTGGINTLNASWNNVNAGGDSSVTYTYRVGDFYGSTIFSGSTTSASLSFSGVSAGQYFITVTPSNSLAAANNGYTTSLVTVSSPPPPPPPPPPYFPPYFPPFFGPYFCLQADSPVMTWVDGKTLQKKVKDLQLGDKIVSYTFAELPENDSEYSLNSWNSQSMTPLEVKEATVVRNEKLITQSTVFFNNDQNNRMSLEHLVFVKRDGTYSIVLAGLVEVGDIILKIDEESLTIYEEAVSSIEHVNEQTEIYKLDVTPYDIFFGGNMLTHNKGGFY